jgi:uncharacterized protein (DUF2249 family)
MPFSRLSALARQRGFDGIELTESDLDHGPVRGAASAGPVVAVYVESPAAVASGSTARAAGALEALVVAARGAVSPDAIAELDALYRRASARLCVTHGTDVEEAARLVEAIERAAASCVFAAWEVRPTRENLGDAPAVLLVTGGALRYIRMRGGGPELADQEGSGIGGLMASVALSGYDGTVTLAPTTPDRAPAWEKWLGGKAKHGCGGAHPHGRREPVDVELDIRPVEPRDRLDTILGAYRALAPGRALHVTFDHDPSCMYYTLQATEPQGSFGFDRVEDGPEVWRVDVRKHAG